MCARQSSSTGGIYAQGKWSQADARWCDLMDQAQSIQQRSDVVDAVLRVLRRCHVALWSADHWSDQRKRWDGPHSKKKLPAFQVSERELSRTTGLSRQRVRTALRVAESEGIIVRLAEPVARGDGRGAIPTTYTFACYISERPSGVAPKESTTTAVSQEKRSKKATAEKWGIG